MKKRSPPLVIRDAQMKPAMSRHHTTTKTAKIKQNGNAKCGGRCGAAARHRSLLRTHVYMGPLWKAAGRPPKDTVTALPGTCPREGKAHGARHTASRGQQLRSQQPTLQTTHTAVAWRLGQRREVQPHEGTVLGRKGGWASDADSAVHGSQSGQAVWGGRHDRHTL